MGVNHCVQAVGYAFTSDDDENEGNNENSSGSGSGSGSNSKSASEDNSKRLLDCAKPLERILGNEWLCGTFLGLDFYWHGAYILPILIPSLFSLTLQYVAMGDNTCGILDDMMQAYI